MPKRFPVYSTMRAGLIARLDGLILKYLIRQRKKLNTISIALLAKHLEAKKSGLSRKADQSTEAISQVLLIG